MTMSGKRAHVWLLLLALLPSVAVATLTAEIDRRQVRLGDSLQLTLSSDGAADPATADLTPLSADFEILQQSSRSSTQIVNGTTTREKSLVVELVPKRTGALQIPALSAGGEQTRPIRLDVAEAAAAPQGDQQVIFSASVDSDSVYVQQQLILTLTLQQAIALDDRSVTELDLDNAYVRPLGQNSYQRTSGGRRWLVHEIRYAVFPEQSGTLTIPAQTFAGRARQGSRSLFDLDSGPRITRSSEAITVEVKPRPTSYPDAVWLPASQVAIEESWSREPDELTTGDSVTRTVTVTGDGLQGAQLPPLAFPDMPGLKYYPDKPRIEEADADTGVVGLRTDSAALVPVKPGVYRIPEVRIPWWDTRENRLRHAVLPAREITVVPAAGAGDTASAEPTAPSVAPQPAAAWPGRQGDAGIWPWVSAAFALAWLLTAGVLVRVLTRPRAEVNRPTQRMTTTSGEANAWKQVEAACVSGNPGHAREALRRWLRTLPSPAGRESLLTFAAEQPDPELTTALADLDAALYGPEKQQNWDGAELLAAARAARRREAGRADTKPSSGDALPPLYPLT